MNTGVYCILNIVNGKKYVGSTAFGFSARLKSHRNLLRRGIHSNLKLQRAWSKYGEYSFRFLIVQRCAPDDAVKREQVWMDCLRSVKNGYNIAPVAGSNRGVPCSPEKRAAISMKNRGRKLTPETRAKMSAANSGKTMSPEAIEKTRNAKIGKPRSAETRLKLSIANRGKTASAETRLKMAKSSRGRKLSPEARLKVSIARRKRVASVSSSQKSFKFE